MVTLFISDLHLCAERPQKIALFKKLLRSAAKDATSLYILGDLFETWIGNDDRTPPYGEIITELISYTSTGNKLFIMRGNRDYLMNQKFAEKIGGKFLDDETLITLNDKNILLMHGDTLCDDVKYRIFRRIINNIISRNIFMLIPYALRIKIWHKIRNATKKSVEKKPEHLTDVHQATVEAKMKSHNVLCLIHGHTHRQAIHEFKLDGQDAKRIVLGDWYKRDSILVANIEGFKLFNVDDYINQNL